VFNGLWNRVLRNLKTSGAGLNCSKKTNLMNGFDWVGKICKQGAAMGLNDPG
jgi:hypothetical protein